MDVHWVDFFFFFGVVRRNMPGEEGAAGVIVSCHRLSPGCMLLFNRGGCCVEMQMQMQISAYSYLLGRYLDAFITLLHGLITLMLTA